MKRDFNDRGLAEEKFRLAVEACPNGMVMFDGHGKTVMVNTEIERQFGYRRESLIGQPVDMLIPVRLRGQYALHREAVNYLPECAASEQIPIFSDCAGMEANFRSRSVSLRSVSATGSLFWP